MEIFILDIGQISSNLLKKAFTTCSIFPLASGFTTLLFRHAQKSKPVTYIFRCIPFLIFLLQWLMLYWACLQFKHFWESIIAMGNVCHGVAKCTVVSGNLLRVFQSNFMQISGSIESVTLIWVSFNRCFPPAELEYWWCQFWAKVMMSEVVVIAGFAQHGLKLSQWVKE